MIAPVRVAAPSSQVLTKEEAKAHLRVDFSADDDFIDALIGAATAYLDGRAGILGRALVTQTWRDSFDAWPCGDRILRLSLAPVVSIASVKYSDAGGVEQTVTASENYALLADDLGAYVRFSPGYAFPDLDDNREDRVRVEYVAGYGAPAAVPYAIKAAALLMIGDLYQNRETVSSAGMASIPMSGTFHALLAPYRRMSA